MTLKEQYEALKKEFNLLIYNVIKLIVVSLNKIIDSIRGENEEN